MTPWSRASIPLAAAVALAAGLAAGPAHAYMGPGVGLSALGSVLAFAVALLLAVVGFVWLPLKRLIGLLRRRSGERAATAADPNDGDEGGDS